MRSTSCLTAAKDGQDIFVFCAAAVAAIVSFSILPFQVRLWELETANMVLLMVCKNIYKPLTKIISQKSEGCFSLRFPMNAENMLY